jgi:hypothetical protein
MLVPRDCLFLAQFAELARRFHPIAGSRRVGNLGIGGVAPSSHLVKMLGRRTLFARRVTRLGLTQDYHHPLLGYTTVLWRSNGD